MPDPNDRSVEERLEHLEATVERLQNTVKGLIDAFARREPGVPRRPAATRPRPSLQERDGELEKSGDEARTVPRRPAPRAPRMEPLMGRGPLSALLDRGPQYWISRLGIGLVLVGVAYLFKYAVDQGWLTPEIRVAFGVALGVVLAAIGFRVREREGWFSQIMFGGAAATWYITGFAAFQLLHVVSLPVAFGFMVLVTVFTFAMSVRQDEPSLAVLGAVGGLGTPFFLYTAAGTVPALMAYTCLVLAGTSAIYLFKGWLSLLWTTAAGAWLVMALAFDPDTYGNRVALQSGAGAIWLLFALVPVVRELLASWNPARWSQGATDANPGQSHIPQKIRVNHVAVVTVATAVVTLSASTAIWEAADVTWGIIAATGTLVYALATFYLRQPRGVAVLASAHAVTAAILAALAIAYLFEQHTQIALWAVEAAALHLLAGRLRDESLGVSGHLLFAVAGLWLLQRIVGEALPEEPVLNARALADAAVIVVAAFATQWLERDARKWYLVAAHVALLAWLWRELTPLTGGDGIVTATWGVYGLGLLLFLRKARNVGLATMFLAVAKLILFDLSQVEAIWRILLFLSFGGVFLAISYYFPGIWKDGEKESDSGS
jgi:uncharacterized membrane protein